MSRTTFSISVNGEERPAHEVWQKLEIATSALACLTRFNEGRPGLASEYTRRIEHEVRNRLDRIQARLDQAKAGDAKGTDLEARARELLQSLGPEDAVSILNQEFGLDLDLLALIGLTGTAPYLATLATEGSILSQNKISPEQIADLWNEAKRPSPGRPFWDALTVQKVLDGEGL